MAAETVDRARGWGRVRRTAFLVWAAVLAMLVGITFVGVTALTILMWLANQNADTNPVTDLGFFALGAVIVATGFAVQLRDAERKVAGAQQAIIGLLALGVAGLIGERAEPLAGSVALLVASAILVALHPARRELFRVGRSLSIPLAALSALAAVPALGYSQAMLVQARQAGPSCFFGQCAYGDRLSEMAALAIAVVALGLLTATRPPGWELSAWSAGAATFIVGSASIVWFELPESLGQAGGMATVVWGLLFAATAEWEKRRGTRVPA